MLSSNAHAVARSGTSTTTGGGCNGRKKRSRDDYDDEGTTNASTTASNGVKNVVSIYQPRKEARHCFSTSAPRNRKVQFSAEEPLIHHFVPHPDETAPGNDIDAPSDLRMSGSEQNSANNTSRLTEELTILSTTHGRARRILRNITKSDLQTAIKHGTKTRAKRVRGERRWKFEYGNMVFITDDRCTKEVTSYWKSVHIEPANITQKMLEDHREAKRILRDEPSLTTTHSIIVVDQSGSMREEDVRGFRTRSEAAYGTLALDYIAEQLYHRGCNEQSIDAVTIIEMNDEGSIFVESEPLDWILFNKVLERKTQARPRSHGNYYRSLQLAETIIYREIAALDDELDHEDLPAFLLVLLSDSRPSDLKKGDAERRRAILSNLARSLGTKLTVFGMGIGAVGSDFKELDSLVSHTQKNGASGDSQFVHAGLSTASISSTFSSMATSMTTTRTALLTVEERTQKTEKAYKIQSKTVAKKERAWRLITRDVSRWKYDKESKKDTGSPWRRQKMKDSKAIGFAFQENPFAKGAERLAYGFYEMKRENGGQMQRVGRMMVAKKSRYIEDEGEKSVFHEHFCRAQQKALSLADEFNAAVRRAPKLHPAEDEVAKPPRLMFLKCRVYEYFDDQGLKHGLLVEDFLMGRFQKYNGNNGYVKKKSKQQAISLKIGEVHLNDFIQAFSHCTYETSRHKLLVCDLQGVLNEEGKHRVFQLTDPAICTKAKKVDRLRRYGKTDIGMKGIRSFCATHKCNGVCKGLGLKSIGGQSDNASVLFGGYGTCNV